MKEGNLGLVSKKVEEISRETHLSWGPVAPAARAGDPF